MNGNGNPVRGGLGWRWLAVPLAAFAVLSVAPTASASVPVSGGNSRTVVVAASPAAPNCPLCPAVSDPVCAHDSVTGRTRTFANECEVRQYNCRNNTRFVVIHRGKCRGD